MAEWPTRGVRPWDVQLKAYIDEAVAAAGSVKAHDFVEDVGWPDRGTDDPGVKVFWGDPTGLAGPPPTALDGDYVVSAVVT